MISLLASVRAGGGLDRVDHAVQLLEDEWRKQGDVPLERLWTEQKRLLEPDAGSSIVMLTELVRTDLRCRFARGQTPTVAGYLARFPELGSADSRVLSLIYEEFCLAEERGECVDVDAFCDRYPQWKESLVSQLQYHHLFSQAAGVRAKVPPYPDAGQTFEEFQLVSLLGRGGTSRVFVAKDLSLGGKQVVLKVSLDRGREPQAQGALDHPHIVPVNSVVFSDDGMRGLSMPYRPGLPLDEVIHRLDPASKPVGAMALWEALVRVPDPPADSMSKAEAAPQPEIRVPGPRGDGWEGFPVRGKYAQGVAWVVKVVADALHYAHGQQTFHRDVKPANVLLTVQHGPQLLDFNLAESPHSLSQAEAAMHGGTLPYMAPEQIEAFLNPDLWGKVGAQADIYSLGLVLRELLTGQAPDLPAQTMAPARAMRVLLDRRPLLDVSVRRTNPAIPHALEAIVAKCLAVSTDERYADAGALAEDLGRFLEHRPLVHAVNPSRRERSADWAYRNRFILAVGAACLLATGFPLGLAIGRSSTADRRLEPIEKSPILGEAMRSLDENRPAECIVPLSRLAGQYSRSVLPNLYLSFAYYAQKKQTDAERCFGDVIEMRDHTSQLLAWSPRDPRLFDRLNCFIAPWLKDAKTPEPPEHLSDGKRNPADTELYWLTNGAARNALEIRTELRRSQGITDPFPVAREASDRPSKTGPNSDGSEYYLALTEQERQSYESVILRVNRALELARQQRPSDTTDEFDLELSLYRWRRLRARAFTKLAVRLRTEGSQANLQEGLRAVASAFEDLKVCDMFATKSGKALEMHSVERVRVEAWMTRIEIELDLGKRDLAQRHVKSARKSLDRYNDLASVVDRRYEVDEFRKWINEIDNRLRQDEAKKSGGIDGTRSRP
jgi:serine/threonine protein kinase